tara:strand:- start:269 stop:460 length:192 start_codon:yes stop_codon:yes gene_type:complete
MRSLHAYFKQIVIAIGGRMQAAPDLESSFLIYRAFYGLVALRSIYHKRSQKLDVLRKGPVTNL